MSQTEQTVDGTNEDGIETNNVSVWRELGDSAVYKRSVRSSISQ